MKNRLPRFTAWFVLQALAALASPQAANCEPARAADAAGAPYAEQAAEPAETASYGGDKLLKQAAAMLDRRNSISARLRHQALIGGERLYGIGSYWQQGSGADLRVRLELQIAGHDASLLQVSNRGFYWIDRRLPTGRSVLRVDLRKLRADPIIGEVNLDELAPGNANWTTLQPELMAHSGGMPGILSSLAENFSFLPPQAMRLAPREAVDTKAASVPVFVVVGHWKHERLRALLGSNGDAASDAGEPQNIEERISLLNTIPARLPQEVLLLVGQADLFPYRIEYRRLETPLGTGRDKAAIPYQLSTHPLAVLELTDVVFDAVLPAGQFDYDPGDADFIDNTAVVLERMHRKREAQLAARVKNRQQPQPIR